MKNARLLEFQSNEQALEWLIDEFAESIKRLAYTYVKDWQAAEDITQEVFLSCYNNLEYFRGECSYKNWLFKITINKCKDFLKGKWIVPKELLERLLRNQKRSELSPEDKVLLMSEERNLSEKVLKLPIKYREVLILYYYEDLKIKEISELTRLPAATIKTRLSRAKNHLRKLYEGE